VGADVPFALLSALLLLYVNEVEKRAVRVLLRDGDVLVAEGELPAAATVEVEGRRYVSLRAAGFAWRIDHDQLALHVDVPPALLPASIIDVQAAARPPDLVFRHDTSAFLNYDLQAPFAATLEPGLSMGPGLLTAVVSRAPGGTWVRGPASFSYDDPARLRRFIAGDTFVITPGAEGDLAGIATLGGASLARDFTLDPWMVQAPLPTAAGAALTPSTLEVYLNGALVRQQKLPPGPFEVRNLPASEGAGTVRAVVRDAFGRVEDVSSSYYFTTSVLSRGVSDYAYAAGLRWTPSAYEEPRLFGRHRLGLTDAITAGAHAEAGRGGGSGGISLALALPFGALELASAGSHRLGRSGAAGALGASFAGSRGNLAVRLRAMTRQFSNASLGPDDERPDLRVDAALSPAIGRLGISATWSASIVRGEARHQLGLQTTIPLRFGATLLLQAATGPWLSALLVWSFGERTAAQAGAQWQGRPTASAGIQRSLPLGDGVGYRVQAGAQMVDAAVQAQDSHGRWTAGWQRLDGSDSATLDAAGALVLIGGKAFLARPVEQSFALVQVPGVEGVRAYLQHQEIGRTNRDGDLLVPGLAPYVGNSLGVEQLDVPLRVDLGRTEELVSAPRRGGALVRFPVRALRPAAGRVPQHPLGTMVVEQAESPLGRGGEFFFEQLAPGDHRARVLWPAGSCSVALHVPPAEKVAQLGDLSCEEGP
jgi:outer membrane usher protein